jgi:hypothetical protein
MGAHDSIPRYPAGSREVAIVTTADRFAANDPLGGFVGPYDVNEADLLSMGTTRDLMNRTIDDFNQTDYCKVLVAIITSQFKGIECKRIVAFGGGSMAQAGVHL